MGTLASRGRSPFAGLGLLAAMLFPTAFTYLYFLVLGGSGTPSRDQQIIYTVGKIIQFSLPIVFVLLVDRRWPTLRRPSFAGLTFGVLFGVLVAGAMLVLYRGWLADSAVLAATPPLVLGKLHELGVTSLAGYLALSAFIVVAHSLLEEYYWRWFVFAQLCRSMRTIPAAAVSSLAFMAHHVIVLYVYFPGQFMTAVVPFSLAVAVGGMVWAWLYHRTGSIYSPWISHLLVDAGIFAIGWDLVRRGGGLG